MTTTTPTGFCAYPSKPLSIGETIGRAVARINDGKTIALRTWQDMDGTGKVLIDEICRCIDSADLFCADLTNLSPNVMFELGYAIMKDKCIWPLLDDSVTESTKKFEQFTTLTTIGYAKYANSQQIIDAYYKEQPYAHLDDTLFRKNIEPNLATPEGLTVLHLKRKIADDASLDIARRLEKSPLEKVISDPKEVALQSLSWYGTNIYRASGVICHLTSPGRDGAESDNAIYTLVAGMAYALDKPLLMLIQSTEDYLAPLDVRGFHRRYARASEALAQLEEWLLPLEQKRRQQVQQVTHLRHVTNLATELRGLHFGDPLAENESDELTNYFVETSAYHEAKQGKHLIFVGRKGAGKTANLYKLADALRGPRTLVCKIQPVGYELQSLLDFLRINNELNKGHHAIETLWKFLIYSEVARAAAEDIRSRPSQMESDEETRLIRLLENPDGTLQDFSTRLEECVRESSGLLKSDPMRSQSTGPNAAIAEALHTGTLKTLKKSLARVLPNYTRISILIDNLDKAWDKQQDLEDLSRFLLGLLDSSERILADLKNDIGASSPANVGLTIFLRSDIFNRVHEIALEPDKIRYYRLNWSHKEELLSVIEGRFMASHRDHMTADEMWEKYFCESVKGEATAEYLLNHILPRPRDLVFFVSKAVQAAVSKRHTRVEEGDVLEAEMEASQNAFKTILVENGDLVSNFEDLLFEFSDRQPIIFQEELDEVLNSAHCDGGNGAVLDVLLELSFLGLEVHDGDFRFPEDPQEVRKSKKLARNYARMTCASQRYKIHPAFHAFLEIKQA